MRSKHIRAKSVGKVAKTLQWKGNKDLKPCGPHIARWLRLREEYGTHETCNALAAGRAVRE